MKVSSSGIVGGIIADKYGKRGTTFSGRMPNYSLPLEIADAPKGTVSYAIIIEDKDSIPVCGFAWIHWVVADLQRTSLLENESMIADDFVQGANSWYGAIGGMDNISASVYGGMTPPDAPHTYEIHVYALDIKLGLKKGFYANALYKAMEGHVLAKSILKGKYYN